MTCEKLKDGIPWTAQAFRLESSPDAVSVFTDWLGDAKTRDGDKVTNADRLLQFLSEHAGEKFTAAVIAEALGLQGAQAKNIYRDLRTLKLAGSVCEETTGKGNASLWYVPIG